MTYLKEAKERAILKVFGNFNKDKNNIDYQLDIPKEELTLFVAVLELMKSGLEYQRQNQNEDEFVIEDINSFNSKLRKEYRSGKRYSFKEWIKVMMDLLDELD